MYNLIMQGAEWKDDHETFSLDRVFEYTDDRLRDKFKPNGKLDLEQIIRLPCLIMEEGTGSEIARICKITNIRQGGGLLNFDYIVEAGMPSLRNEDIYASSAAFGFDNNFEFSRTHWAIKDVNLYKAALKASKTSRSMPTVFKLNDPERVEDDQLSVMMPFNGSFKPVYDSIKAMAKSVGMRCNRGDDIWKHDAIIQDIVELIDKSKIVVCDCSGRNPNVFYEIGIAHALGRSVILITQSKDDVPFDLRHLRYINYLNNAEGRTELCKMLKERVNTLVG